jgi:hypothetical protein
MHSTALPLTLPSLTNDRRQDLLKQKPLLSLYELFATVPDPRSKHGLRYELAFVLTCLVAALLCHCDSTLSVRLKSLDRELAHTIHASWKTRDTTRQAIKGCRNLLSRRRKGQGPKDLMQTYIDRRSPSQVKVGH